MENISRHLEAQTEPISRNQVELAVVGKAQYKRVALDILIAEQFATETPSEHHNSKLVQTLRPYREDDPQNNPLRPARPTSSHFVPDEVPATSSRSSPPYKGGPNERDEVDAPWDDQFVPDENDLPFP